ncbi:MAG: RNA polymerase sigma factor region1.1 domain-containing protein [Brevefilum sp.]|nr:RNA polymerase sigma factor region1.1 domain-containing protein [Brevefilum sp.]
MSESQPTSTEYVSPLARLFHKARSQGYLTYDEILAVMPYPDLTLDQLDRLFAALLAAEIPYGDAGALGAHPGDNQQGS